MKVKSLSEISPKQTVCRLLLGLIAAATLMVSGCSRLRLPAIDSTGQRIFAPLPTTTSIALPGSAGEGVGCLRGLRGLGSGTGLQWPTPVFKDPADPPPCLVPAPAVPESNVALGATNEPCVPSEPCTESCQVGPPAVLFGRECQMRDVLRLPNRGKRGCILLSPQKIVAPVGGEVVLLSGICGNDGYLQVGEPLEWMLTPDSVGTLIQVGDDDPGFLHRLARLKKAEKKDGSYARGVTSTKRTLITRGNLDPRDDVQLEKGQTWITLSSPSEGTSRVTVLAPESDCWDNRKATATIYWVDARWQYPNSQIVSADTPVSLTTRVTRSEGQLPARGWKVRYEILEPGLATFAGTNGQTVFEAEVGEDGNATAELIPAPGLAGTTPVAIEVIRPGGETDNIPTMTLSRGQTFVTWSAPQLILEAAAPAVATFNLPVEVAAVVKNPGDQPAENVRVTMAIPPGVKASSTDQFSQNVPSAIVWDIGTLPGGQQIDLFANVTAQAPTELSFEARADGLVATDSVRIDVYRPSLMLKVTPERERYETGEPITFNVDVTNTGDRAIQDVRLQAVGDGALVDQEQGRPGVGKPKTDGPLQPGETWPVAVVFVPTDAGRRCIDVTATGAAGQQAQSKACVTVINPVPATPALAVKLQRRDSIQMGGQSKWIKGTVANTGEVPLTDVRATIAYDPQLQVGQATAGAKAVPGQFMVAWDIPTLAPGESKLLELEVNGTQPNPRSQIVMSAQSKEGALSSDSYTLAIIPPPSPAAGPPSGTVPGTGGSGNPFGGNNPDPGTTLPPAEPPPTIPGGPAPIPAPNRGNNGSASGGTGGSGASPGGSGGTSGQPPARTRTNRLQTSLALQDNPVLVNDPIRYRLQVMNDFDQTDNSIQLRFRLPDGVKLERAAVVSSPELAPRTNAGVVILDIPTMKPGEVVDYTIVLSSNQPQTFELVVEGDSQLQRTPFQTRVKTTVVP